jgi:hypothetical protein
LLTFALALATWFVITSGNQYEFDETIPVRTRGLQEQGRMLVSDQIPEVTTRIRGRGWSLWQEYLFNRAWYDLPIVEGSNSVVTITLQPEQVIIPAATNLAPVAVLKPRQLELRIDEMATVLLRVEPQLALDLMPGYRQVGQPVVIPDTVRLTAPASILDTVTSISTELIKKTGVDSPLEITTTLVIPFNHLIPSRQEVTVKLDVQPLLELEYSNLAVETRNLPDNVSILLDPPVVSALIAGPSSYMRELTADQLNVSVDFSNWRPESPRLVPDIAFPDGVELITTTPEQVKIRLIVE